MSIIWIKRLRGYLRKKQREFQEPTEEIKVVVISMDYSTAKHKTIIQ